MQLKFSKSVVKGICSITGPQVAVVLADTGQANVMINVALSDGTHFHFPDGSGAQASLATVLPPGDYDCAIMVAAFGHGAFGSTYNATVSFGGKKVASAAGSLAAGVDSEDTIDSFLLRVR